MEKTSVMAHWKISYFVFFPDDNNTAFSKQITRVTQIHCQLSCHVSIWITLFHQKCLKLYQIKLNKFNFKPSLPEKSEVDGGQSGASISFAVLSWLPKWIVIVKPQKQSNLWLKQFIIYYYRDTLGWLKLTNYFSDQNV